MKSFRNPVFAGVMVCTLGVSGANSESHFELREGGLTGTGIVGVITELGSIRVNGQRITFADDMTVRTPLGNRAAADLLPSETVAVAVEPSGSDWAAVEMFQTYPLLGPVDKDDAGYSVMGTRISPAQEVSFGDVTQGDWVAVSGLWKGNSVIATKLTAIAPQPEAYVHGAYASPLEGEPLRIGETIISGVSLKHANPGDVIQVRGAPDGNTLTPTEVRLGLFDKPVAVLSVQGFISMTDPTGEYSILGSGVTVFSEDGEDMTTSDVAIYCGVQGQILQANDTLPMELKDKLAALGCDLN